VALDILGSRAEAETRIALVIGNSAYQSLPNLRNPVNDARAMDQELSALGFHVTRLENATKVQIDRGLSELYRQTDRLSVSLVYYAGHGMQLHGENYLLPVDAKVETATSTTSNAVSVDQIIEQILRARARTNIIILDACRDSPFVSGVGANTSLFRGVSGGLALMSAPANTLIAFATAPGRVAADGSAENGLYTAELIKAIDIPGASIETVFKQTRLSVITKSGGTQIPWESSSLATDFTFHR
jgi:uncharacterized caspase-like protein